jgi:hypothetical protein
MPQACPATFLVYTGNRVPWAGVIGGAKFLANDKFWQ